MASATRLDHAGPVPLVVEPLIGLAPVLVVGRGMLGRAFEQELARRDDQFDAFDVDQLNILDPAQVADSIRPGRRIVINCAAWTDVDAAESDEAGALALNAAAVERLAAQCRGVGATLVHFSADYVFDGLAQQPYRTDHPRSPVNVYGRSKAAGELAVESSGCDHLLIRTSWMYAPWGKNFVRTIAGIAARKPTIRVVNDQRGRPTSAEHLARATLRLLDADARGTFHVTDGGECTWHEFAAEIVRQSGACASVEPCASTEMARPARRPAFSTLDISETESIIGPMPPWQDNLRAVIGRLE